MEPRSTRDIEILFKLVVLISRRKQQQSWFENPEVIDDIRCKAKNFTGFANENEREGNVKFIFTSIPKSTDQKVVAIEMYEDGRPTEFEPPGEPEKP